ncbi:hypothetical protein DPMN_068559 [Dreissena polymorpha]|uniref:Uncharacterized protein n=1 Tax=Dreissena polymorpha TaxID=45954 RepID=A0A9D4BUA9_DREPO|nr:hypothetical protein DPMN_068559 [Dreissena polymorpha]
MCCKREGWGRSASRKPHLSGMVTANRSPMLPGTGIKPRSPRRKASVATTVLP